MVLPEFFVGMIMDTKGGIRLLSIGNLKKQIYGISPKFAAEFLSDMNEARIRQNGFDIHKRIERRLCLSTRNSKFYEQVASFFQSFFARGQYVIFHPFYVDF